MARTWTKAKLHVQIGLEPKALPSFITKEPVVLEASDVSRIAYHVSRYVRTFQAAASA